MSVFKDYQVRQVLNTLLLSMGTPVGDVSDGIRLINLSDLGIPDLTGEYTIQVVGGELPPNSMQQGMTWVEAFLVKAPQSIKTPSEAGLSHKEYQYTLWIKTDKSYGLFINEAISGYIENHFQNNKHLQAGNDTLTILKSYQQPLVIADNNTGRLFNRVFVDCELYYNNNN